MNNITRSTYDRQYEHCGLVRHGVQTGPWRVEFDAPLKRDASGNYLKVKQGTVVSLDSNGEYIPGCAAGATATNHPVPFIALKNVNDPDVMTGYEGKTLADSTISGVGGVITAIPCTSGYEISTTEFDPNLVYAPNDALTAAGATGTAYNSVTSGGIVYTYYAPANATGAYAWKNGDNIVYTITRTPTTSNKVFSRADLASGESGSSAAAITAVGTATINPVGQITKATVKPGLTEPYIGFVTLPPYKDHYKNDRIAFLTCFIPAGFTAE